MKFSAVQFDDAAKKRIRQAAELEKRLRLEAFLGVSTEIGPFEMRPLEIRHVLEMEYGENRLNKGVDVEIDDLVHLLWIVKPASEKRTEKSFAKFVSSNMNPVYELEIKGFFFAQFSDLPSSKAEGASRSVGEFESAIWLGSLLDRLCSEYGWTIKEVMQTPISVAFQLLQCILKRDDPKYAFRNSITQAAKAKEIKERNYRG